MQGSIIERLGGDIWRQESKAEVRDNANVRIGWAHCVEGAFVFRSFHGWLRSLLAARGGRDCIGHDIVLTQRTDLPKPTSEHPATHSEHRLSEMY